MDQNEAQAIDAFFAKLEEAARSAPPRDAEAEARIAQWVQRVPGAAYYLTQTAIVTGHALEAAQARVHDLEAAAAQGVQHRSGGFLSGLFGGGQAPAPQPTPSVPSSGPVYAAPAGPWGAPAGGGLFGGGGGGAGGGGFLASAAQTAAGVAGGMLAANAIENLFSGHERSGLFGGGGQGLFGGDPGGAGSGQPIDLHYSAADSGGSVDDSSADAGAFDSGGMDDGSFDSASDDGGF